MALPWPGLQPARRMSVARGTGYCLGPEGGNTTTWNTRRDSLPMTLRASRRSCARCGSDVESCSGNAVSGPPQATAEQGAAAEHPGEDRRPLPHLRGRHRGQAGRRPRAGAQRRGPARGRQLPARTPALQRLPLGLPSRGAPAGHENRDMVLVGRLRRGRCRAYGTPVV